jgi:DNA-damage-inducible protein D
MIENESAAKTGGQLAKRARLELEGKTGKKVVSGENFLPPPQRRSLKKK